MNVFLFFKVLDHSLPLLARLLEERTTQLHMQLQQMHMQPLNISASNALDCLFEDIHWLLLISGILCYFISYEKIFLRNKFSIAIKNLIVSV